MMVRDSARRATTLGGFTFERLYALVLQVPPA